MLSRFAQAFVALSFSQTSFTSVVAHAQSVRIGPDYPPGSPSGWTCLALSPYANAVLAYSATVDPAPACQTLQDAINQGIRATSGGWNVQGAVAIEDSARQHYANDPGCLPDCIAGLSAKDRRFSAVCDITVGSVEYAVFSADPKEPLCGLLQILATPQPSSDGGVTVTDDNTGQQTYLAPGTFVKIGEAPAIYLVDAGQLHAFSTWPQFMNAGGRADLSNVVHYASLRDSGGLFGAPVQ